MVKKIGFILGGIYGASSFLGYMALLGTATYNPILVILTKPSVLTFNIIQRTFPTIASNPTIILILNIILWWIIGGLIFNIFKK